MVHDREDAQQAEAVRTQEAPQHQGARLAFPQGQPEGPAQAPVDPWFPDREDAVAANQQSLLEHGQGNHALLRPDVLEGALGRAQNYWHYENDLPKAAAALMHGVGQSQAFEDGNKRTAFNLGRIFLDQNHLGHVSPLDRDDEELADHLIGYGEGTHQMEDTANLIRQRMGRQRQSASPVSVVDVGGQGGGWEGQGRRPFFYEPHLRTVYLGQLGDEHAQVANTMPPEAHARHQDIDGEVNYQVPETPVLHYDGIHHSEVLDALRSHTGDDINTLEGHRQSNILDPIHDTLDPRVWVKPAALAPTLRPEHSNFIYETIFTALDGQGYDGMENWLSIVFTGSLTTYQYSDDSDVDISLFVDTENFPDWSRAEMIVAMIHHCDGTTLPGTPFPLQCFVVPPEVGKEDLYQPGTRSGYDLSTDTWIVPPDRSRVHDVQKEMNAAYTIALENADKMEKLLRYEPDKATLFWHQIHKRRQRDMKKGRGDYSPSNITYKMLANRGLFPQISEVSGEYIASTGTQLDLSGLVF